MISNAKKMVPARKRPTALAAIQKRIFCHFSASGLGRNFLNFCCHMGASYKLQVIGYRFKFCLAKMARALWRDMRSRKSVSMRRNLAGSVA